MVVASRDFTDGIILRIREVVASGVELTRGKLARQVCEWLEWTDHHGRPKETSCRIALNRLEQRGLIELPAAREVSFAPRSPKPEEPLPPWLQLKAPLSRLGEVELVLVNGERELSGLWRAMMREHHPLRDGPLCGAQLRYVIRCPKGVLGGLSFSAAAGRLAVRDEGIGWSERMREQRLPLVVGNSRFLILPGLDVKNLASHVLGLATRRLAGDWLTRYGVRPVLVETFVDSSRYEGTSYRAANWRELGYTQGRGRQDHEGREQIGAKRVLVYPLARDWRKILTAALDWPRIVPGVRLSDPADWAEAEFGRCRLSTRLTQRLCQVARDFYARPQGTIPQACEGEGARIAGTYRLLANEDATIETLLQSHYAATEERLAQRRGEVILAAQDTTSVNYSELVATRGLGPIGTTVGGAQGLHLHSTLAITTDGLPLGFVDAQCWARDPQEFGQNKQALPIEDKESHRWIRSYRALAALQKRLPEVRLVSVADREGDIFELFAEAAQDAQGPRLLIRAKHDRALKDQAQRLFAAVDSEPAAGYLQVQLPRQHARKARKAKLTIRFATLWLAAPQGKSKLPAVEVQVVHAVEDKPPRGVEPIDWWLVSTLPVASLEQAVEVVQWYGQRWNIEVFHRTLKSGCRIEDRRLGDAQSLEACLAIDMVVAWRICHLVKLGREVPHAQASIYFAEAEWKALVVFSTKNPEPPQQPPTLRQAVRMVAKLGGFQGRKSDGEPGTEAIWLGLQRLDDITTTWKVIQIELQQSKQLNIELQRRVDELRAALAKRQSTMHSGP
jgi:hypothetical protein